MILLSILLNWAHSSRCWLKVKLIEKLKLLHSLNSAHPWLRTNSQYLAKSKQNVHKYNQKYFYYLPNKLSFLSQNEFERIIFNEVILARFSSVLPQNSVKIYLYQTFPKSLFDDLLFCLFWAKLVTQCWPAGLARNPIRLCEAKNNLVLRRIVIVSQIFPIFGIIE